MLVGILRMAAIEPAPAATPAAQPFVPPSGYRFKTWTTENGLPQNWIECLTQTPDGFLWLGTQNGLVQFDGVKFTTVEDQMPAGLDTAFAKQFAQDTDGNLWAATKRYLLKRENGGFRAFTRADGLCGAEVTSVCASRDGGVWVGTEGGINRISNGRIESFPSRGLSRPFIYAVREDAEGRVWVGTYDGLARVDLRSGSYQQVWEARPPPKNDDHRIVRFISQDSHGTLWFGTDIALGRRHAGVCETVSGVEGTAAYRLRSVYEDRSGGLWLVKGNGLSRWIGDHFVAFPGANEVSEAQLRCLFQDREGNHWLGGAFGGLTRMQPRVLTPYTTRDGLCHNEVWSVSPASEGGVWVGTAFGTGRFHSGKFESLPRPNSLPAQVDILNCRSIIEDSLGAIWVGTGFYNVLHFQKTDRGLVAFGDDAASSQIRTACADPDGSVWIGARGGLAQCRRTVPTEPHRAASTHIENWYPAAFQFRENSFIYQEDSGKWIQRTNGWTEAVGRSERPISWAEIVSKDTTGWTRDLPEGKLSNYDVRAILRSRSGTLWIGTGGGLNRLVNRRFTALTTRDGLVSDSIQALHEDADGVLWIGTHEGLSRLSAPASAAGTPERITSFTTREGLFDNLINAIVEDDAGYLWLSCRRGISRVSRRELNDVAAGRRSSVRSLALGEADGMLSAETSGSGQPTGCKTPDGMIWFATVRGLVKLDPSRIRENNVPPPVHIEELHSGGHRFWRNAAGSGASDSLKDAAPVTDSKSQPRLPPGTGRVIEFRYTAASFSAPEKVRFKYRLEGHDPAWVDAGERRTAFYTNLRPGSYQFQVIACNNDNLWNQQGDTLAFTLAPFVHETWWFRTGAGLAALALASSIIAWRMNAARRIATLERQMALSQERRRIARDLHDHIGSHLTRLVVGAGDPPPGADGQPGRISDTSMLATSALHGLDQVVWLTDPAKDTLQHTIEYLSRHAREFLDGTGIQLRLDIPVELPDIPISAALRHELVRVVEESLANALKHSAATEIRLHADITPSHATLNIEDNGRGFDPATARDAGNGLSNMTGRMEEIGGRCTIESRPGSGTRIILELPTLA
jgi:ligand-binding sensor domain-containing protein/signal transduction histidine kinase